MQGHVHDSALFGLIVFAWVLLFGLGWNLAEIHLVSANGEKKQILGKAMANFY